MRKTKGRLKVVWAMKMVRSPSFNPMPEKKIESDTPMMISGSTMGKNETIWVYDLMRKRYQLTPMAPSVPRTVAVAAEVDAISILFQKARQRLRELRNNCSYQINEKPVQCILFAELNE
jgi:hypothetical protein